MTKTEAIAMAIRLRKADDRTTGREIVQALECAGFKTHTKAVGEWLRNAGCPLVNRCKVTPQMAEIARRMRGQGKTYREIAAKLRRQFGDESITLHLVSYAVNRDKYQKRRSSARRTEREEHVPLWKKLDAMLEAGEPVAESVNKILAEWTGGAGAVRESASIRHFNTKTRRWAA